MIKSTLFISLGGAGSKLLNELMNVNPNVNGIFVNSNENEIRRLSNFNIEDGNYLTIKGNGTARSRQKSKESIENDKTKVMEFVNNLIGNYSTYVLITSLDGGFGSGSFPMICKAIKNLNKRTGIDVDVNIIGICPKTKSRRINLQNTLEAYNDIIQLSKNGFISSYQFINNNKMKNVKEFNREVMEEINNAYSIANIELDLNDAKAINNAKGYKVILNLKPEMSNNLKDAIMYAQQTSNFILPKNIGRATHIGISFIEDEYDTFEALDLFTVTEFDKEDYNDDNNIIILSGIENPNEAIQEYENELNKIENDDINNEDGIFISNVSSNTMNKYKPKQEKPKSKPLTKQDLRDLADDIW